MCNKGCNKGRMPTNLGTNDGWIICPIMGWLAT
jgi:hypothetical protein